MKLASNSSLRCSSTGWLTGAGDAGSAKPTNPGTAVTNLGAGLTKISSRYTPGLLRSVTIVEPQETWAVSLRGRQRLLGRRAELADAENHELRRAHDRDA